MTDIQNTDLIAASANGLSNKKRENIKMKDLVSIGKTLIATPEELIGIRAEIKRLSDADEAKLIYEQGEEKIILYRGTLSGYLRGMYFGCWCHMPGVKLFFNESKSLDRLQKSPEMKPERVRQFLGELDETLSSDPSLHYIRIQMQSVRELWEADNTNFQQSTNNHVTARLQEQIAAERKRVVNRQIAEAQAAAERRHQNEERTRERKAQREAERLKRKKIAETTKRINADAAKIAAERRAEEQRKIQMQKEAQLRAQEEQRKAEIERAINNMYETFGKNKNLPPVYERDKNGNDCFYLKINGKLIHIVMSETEPLCHFISRDPVRSRLLTPYDIQDVMTSIDTHLNANGDFDNILENFASFYASCQQIVVNREERRNKKNKDKDIGPYRGATVPHSDIEPLFKKVCRRLLSPSTFEMINQKQRG